MNEDIVDMILVGVMFIAFLAYILILVWMVGDD